MSYVLVISALNIDVTFVKSAKRSLVSGFNRDLSQKAPSSPPSHHRKLDRDSQKNKKTEKIIVNSLFGMKINTYTHAQHTAQVMFALIAL